MRIKKLNERMGITIHMIRAENRLSQQEFAKRIGVNERSVRRWESGECYPSWLTLEKIEKVFGYTFTIFARSVKKE